MKAKVRWLENVAFAATTDSGHEIIMDGSPDVGGENRGPRPMEVVLAGTGACSAIDVVLILKKARQAVSDCWVELEADRATSDPKVFTRIHFHFVVKGKALDHAKVERAVQLSADVYCSASAMLAKTAKVTHDVEIIEDK
jgi:putative redox protein